MPSQAIAEPDSAFGVIPAAPWRVRSIQVAPGYRLAVTFQDGSSGTVDLSAVASGRDVGIYAPLRDPGYFAQARVEWGVVTWPNGADLDPAWMHDEIGKADIWVVPL